MITVRKIRPPRSGNNQLFMGIVAEKLLESGEQIPPYPSCLELLVVMRERTIITDKHNALEIARREANIKTYAQRMRERDRPPRHGEYHSRRADNKKPGARGKDFVFK